MRVLYLVFNYIYVNFKNNFYELLLTRFTKLYKLFYKGQKKRIFDVYFIYMPILFLGMFADNALGTTFQMDVMGQSVDVGYGWAYVIVGLLHFLPSLSVVVRRLHDVGKSGWFYLIILIPLIGIIWMLVLLVSNGDVGENKYGADPKA